MLWHAGFAAASPMAEFSLWRRVMERVHGWRRKQRWIGELKNAVQLGRLDDTLNNVGITRAELELIVNAPNDAGNEFGTFAELAHTAFGRLDPAARRQAAWVCIHCRRRIACKRWLRTGVWRGDGSEMLCPNAGLFRD